jgi:5'-nucleotidase
MQEQHRRILITNDDGIEADGLLRLVKEAVKFGEVWVVAPDGQRSAASHSIVLQKPLDVYPYDLGIEGVHAFSCSGMPGDCVRVGSLSVMPYKPDVVLAGINDGYNAASDIQYSATVGAALEAAFQGYPAIALSEGRMGHQVTDHYLHEVLAELIDQKPGNGNVINVNFPECPIEQYRGILRERKVSKRMLFKDSYPLVEELPDGGKRYLVHGERQETAEDGTDLRALFDGYISIGTVSNLC